MKTKPLVSIIIVTWNSADDIKECLESVSNVAYSNYNVIVWDNNSDDETPELVNQNFPDVDLVEHDKNSFYAGGNNLAIKHANEKYNPDYYLILNPDTKVERNLIDALLEPMLEKQVGITGPKIKFYKNKFEGKINSAGMVFDGFMMGYDRGFEEEDNGQFEKKEEVPAVTGACMMIKKECMDDLKGFWKILKMYLEDLELCIRAQKKGWKIIYTPETTVWHKWMRSTNQSKIVKVEKWKKRNWLLIALRHYKLKSKLAMVKNYLLN